MKDIVLFGIQGSGKGTQSTLLQELYGDRLSYFSSGDIFRALKSHPNAIGDYLSNKLELGQLITDEVTISLFRFYFSTLVSDKKSMLLDGYPRTLAQLVDLVQTCLHSQREVVGIYFELSREEAKKRMLGRGRADDTPESVDKRLDLFFQKTLPNIELFEKFFPVIRIDASPSIEEVHEQVKNISMSTKLFN
ncbi:Adenylate kinase [candidate division SR1 bacterium Aalborg_AAW-1]|nr:Adenylate kinase [candidate division SR1 bacterium Aalborg_AAW-1]